MTAVPWIRTYKRTVPTASFRAINRHRCNGISAATVRRVGGLGSFIVDDRIIAIIDDDALVRDSVTRLIRSMGYRAEKFSSTEELLATGSLRDTWCIISDVTSADGTTSRLQDLVASIGCDIPIVFMTGRLNPAMKMMLMAAGAVHVLAKPF